MDKFDLTYTKWLKWLGLWICMLSTDWMGAIDYSSLRFEHLRTQDGLSNSTVNAITKDGDGFMWFGTNDGLNRYDGHTFVSFRNRLDDTTSLCSSRVNALVTDSAGRLWVGTTGGLNLYDSNKNCFYQFKHDPQNEFSLQNNAITYLFFDSIHNALWISAAPEGICKLDLSSLDLEKSTDGVHFHQFDLNDISGITGYLLDDHHRLVLFGRDDHAYYYQDETANFVKLALLPNPDVPLQRKSKTAIKDVNGKWWILSGGKSYVFEDTSDSKENFAIKLNRKVDYWAETSLTDSEGNIWFGTDEIQVLNPNSDEPVHRFAPTVSEFSISRSEKKCMYLDDQDVLWIGTATDGINKCHLKPAFFNYYLEKTKLSKGLSGKVVTSIISDQEQNIWFSLYDGGISILDPLTREFSHIGSGNDGLSINKILDVYQDKNGVTWAGSWTGGLNRIERKNKGYQCSKVNFKVTDPYGLDCIWRITEDFDENLWLATQEIGIVLFDRETKSCLKFNHVPEESSSIRGNMVISLLCDSQNRLFAGTYLGLDVLDLSLLKETDEAVFHHFPDFESLNGCRINHIYEDSKGFIWICTDGKGLSVLSPTLDSIQVFSEKDGLPGNVVMGISEDKDGNYWISYQGGIAMLNAKSKRFEVFDENNGLFVKEFRRGSVYMSSSGNLYMGSVEGAVYFNPENQSLIESPKVYLQALTIDNQKIIPGAEINGRILLSKKLSDTEGIKLLHKENTFSISFTSLDYDNPLHTYYYQLAGKDTTWHYLKDKHEISYQNLKPGSYVFKVRSGIKPLDVQAPETHLQIGVKRSFYQKPLFYLLLILMVTLGIGYVYARYRKKIKALTDDLTSLSRKKESYSHSRLKDEAIHHIQQKLNQYILTAKPYLNPELKLAEVAEAIEVSVHELSQVINQDLNTTFPEYINRYRTEEFIAKLKDADMNKFTIMAIAEQCGFKSKSSFYRSFKKVTGTSPAEFISNQT